MICSENIQSRRGITFFLFDKAQILTQSERSQTSAKGRAKTRNPRYSKKGHSWGNDQTDPKSGKLSCHRSPSRRSLKEIREPERKKKRKADRFIFQPKVRPPLTITWLGVLMGSGRMVGESSPGPEHGTAMLGCLGCQASSPKTLSQPLPTSCFRASSLCR